MSAARTVPASARGALWMLLSATGFALMTALIRQASLELHPFVVMFFRSLFGVFFMLPWVLGAGLGVLRTKRWQLYLVRGTVGVFSMMCWFIAVSHMALAEAVALFFTSSLFATILASVALGETVRARRWIATVIGFAGVLIILRPGFASLSIYAVLVLTSAACVGGSLTLIKVLSRTEPSGAIVTYMVLILTPLSLIPALFFWQWPSLEGFAWLIALAGTATVGHFGMTRAFKLADSSAMIPFAYAQLPITALIGFVAFAEVPDAFTWLGGGVIIVSSVYIAHREAVRGRIPPAVAGGADTPPPPAPR